MQNVFFERLGGGLFQTSKTLLSFKRTSANRFLELDCLLCFPMLKKSTQPRMRQQLHFFSHSLIQQTYYPSSNRDYVPPPSIMRNFTFSRNAHYFKPNNPKLPFLPPSNDHYFNSPRINEYQNLPFFFYPSTNNHYFNPSLKNQQLIKSCRRK